MEVKEVSQFKIESERELNKIKDEIERKRITDLLYENKFKQVLDRQAPHNNLHIPIEDVHPIYNQKGQNRHLNLKSTSTMVFAKEEMNERNYDQRPGNLMQREKNLTYESEFIPVTESKHYDRPEKSEAKNTVNEPYVLDDKFDAMYSKLEDITEMNHKMDPGAKYRTIKSNYEKGVITVPSTNRHNNANNDNRKDEMKEDMMRLDNLLKTIVENDNKMGSEVDNNHVVNNVQQYQSNDLIFVEDV